MKMLKALITAGIFAAACGAASAEDTGFHFGGGVGWSHLDSNTVDRSLRSAIADGGATGTVDSDDENLAWKVFFGYDFGKNFGVEVGYVDLGESETDYTITAPAAGMTSNELDITGYTVSAVIRYPFGDNFEVFGKVGGFFAEFDNSTNSTGFGPFTIDGSGSDDGDTSFTGGVGFRFEVTDHVHVRADWDRYINVGAKRDIDSFTGGLEYAF